MQRAREREPQRKSTLSKSVAEVWQKVWQPQKWGRIRKPPTESVEASEDTVEEGAEQEADDGEAEEAAVEDLPAQPQP